MRVLIVAPYFYPVKGGLELYAFNIARRLVNKGHVIRVLCNDDEDKDEIIEGIEVIRLKRNFTISNTPIRLDLFFHISRNIRSWKPDVINAHIPVVYSADTAAVVSKLHGLPFVLTYHNETTHERPLLNLIAKIYNWSFNLLTLGLSHKIIVASPFSYYESPFIRRFLKKVAHIPPGVDVNLYTPDRCFDLHQQYNLPPEARVVLFIGQISSAHRHKGIGILLRSFQRVLREKPNSYLVLIGTGDRVEFYRSYSAELGIFESVFFSGHVSEKNLIKSYQSTDVVVLPSTTVQEGFGMVLIEGAACGKPVIGSSIGGIKYIIQDNIDGFTVSPNDEISLADAIIRVLSNDNLAKQMGAAGRQKAEHYDWSIATDATEAVLNSVVRNP